MLYVIDILPFLLFLRNYSISLHSFIKLKVLFYKQLIIGIFFLNFNREAARRSDNSSDHSESSGSLDCSPLSYIGSRSRDQASVVYDILVDTYTQIGDSDAISGCEVVATDSQAILKHSYLIDKKWDGLLKISDLNNSKVEILQVGGF